MASRRRAASSRPRPAARAQVPPKPAAAAPPSVVLAPALAAAALLALTLLAYLPVLRAGFIWDDDRYVTQNVLLHSVDGLRTIWLSPSAMLQYYPLTHSGFWLQYRLWGLDAAGYHLVNVVLHAVSAIVLWRILRRLEVPASWLVAAVFAIHPVQVESVAWVSELKNVLSGLFYLLAVLALLRAGAGTRWAWTAALLGYLAAMLAKSVTCTLPAALVPVLWWRRGRLALEDLRRLAPFFVLGVLIGLPTIWMERRLGAEGGEWSMGLVERCLVAGRALWFYAGKLLWPLDLSFVYPRWHIDATAWWQYLFPLAAVAVGVGLWAARGRLGRAPLAAVLFFAITLGPALGFFNLFPMRYSFVADHFQYLASIGLIALFVGGAAAVSARWRARPPGTVVGRAAAALLLLLLGAATWRQAGIYHDDETLWRDTLRKNPAAWMAHNNLGLLLMSSGRNAEAAQHFEQALALRPNFVEALYNLGNISAGQGQLDAAASYYERALAVEPLFAPAHNNLANIYAYQGRFAEAITHYERALEILPDYTEARNNLNAVRGRAGAPPGPAP